MCDFKNDRTVMVCDVAIGHIRNELQKAAVEGVKFTHVDWEGTLVEADPEIDVDAFTQAVRAGIAEAARE